MATFGLRFVVYRTDGVNDVLAWEIVRFGDFGRTSIAPIKSCTFFYELATSGAVDSLVADAFVSLGGLRLHRMGENSRHQRLHRLEDRCSRH